MRGYKAMGIIFLLVMAAIALLGYRYYKSPGYALTRIARAMEAHDQRNFDKYVDREKLSANLADDLVSFTSSMIDRKYSKESGDEKKDSHAGMARMMAEAMKPRMIAEIDQAILKLVEPPDTAGQEGGKPRPKKKFSDILSLLSIEGDFSDLKPGDVTVEVHGDSTYLAAMNDKKEGKKQIPLTGTMKKQDGVWRLTDVDYLEYIMSKHGFDKSGDEK